MNRFIPSTRLVLPLVALVVTALLASCGAGSPQDAAEDFYRAVEAGEITEAMEMLSADTYEDLGREKIRTALEMQTRRIAEQGGIERFEVTEEKIMGEIADLEVEITLGDGTIMNETVHLRKVDREWKIESRK